MENKTWKKYLGISILFFIAFLLEYVAIFLIEMTLLHMDISQYGSQERSIHHGIMAIMWILYTGFVLLYCQKHHMLYHDHKHQFIKKEICIVLFCVLCCKVLTFIDWHTFKVIGEFQGKTFFEFIMQYVYYFIEVGLVVLIITFAQKAFELRNKQKSSFPYGGWILAFTWGIFHFVSRGVGIEVWNGISCMMFSILSGIMYVQLRNVKWSYVFIAISYLL